MKLTSEQSQILRAPFEKVGAFAGRSEEEVRKLLESIADIYIPLAKIKLKKLKDENNLSKDEK